ncbi:hypothetical protein HPB51_025162 [Rhipicephalus microplus]|uniref:Uncharacterized protein n=1 Tax=Rhipicephalus microplus TaxID=6941 RepID=A0A9J6EK68_RHIMP|nr:hypothetical protein HPB51_025162 [Rhipicephalus microplus]
MVPVLVAAGDVPLDTLAEMADRVADYSRAHSLNVVTTTPPATAADPALASIENHLDALVRRLDDFVPAHPDHKYDRDTVGSPFHVKRRENRKLRMSSPRGTAKRHRARIGQHNVDIATSKRRAQRGVGEDLVFVFRKRRFGLARFRRNACDIVMHSRELIHKAPPLRTSAFFAKRLLVESCCHSQPFCYRGGVGEASVLCSFKAGTCVKLQVLGLSYAMHSRLLRDDFNGQPRAFMGGFLAVDIMTHSSPSSMCG